MLSLVLLGLSSELAVCLITSMNHPGVSAMPELEALSVDKITVRGLFSVQGDIRDALHSAEANGSFSASSARRPLALMDCTVTAVSNQRTTSDGITPQMPIRILPQRPSRA